jgi:hypothetical protein
MTRNTTRARTRTRKGDTVIWIDHREAVIVGRDEVGKDSIEVVERQRHENEAGFDIRAVEQVADRDRVVVSGPAFARTQFERAYVAMTRRPDRLVDVEPTDTR